MDDVRDFGAAARHHAAALADRSDTAAVTRHVGAEWPSWQGETAVCIATGPSLTPEQVEQVKRASVRTIGINDVGLTEDWIDVWYAADWPFWRFYEARAEASQALKVCADVMSRGSQLVDLFLCTISNARAERYEPGFVLSGGHSGFQALQMAISFGATRVILLGYDCKPRGTSTNYFGRKPKTLDRASNYEAWVTNYDRLAVPAGVEVLNATPGSAITAFPRVSLDDVL